MRGARRQGCPRSDGRCFFVDGGDLFGEESGIPMPKYLWKGTAPDGRLKVEAVEAESPKEARAVLEGQGWKDLTLQGDDVFFYAGQQALSAADPELAAVEEDPEIQVQRMHGKGPGFFSNFWGALRGAPIWNLLLLAGLVWGLYRGRYILATISGIGLLIFPALYAFFSLPGLYYARLQRAKVWGRWDEVARCVDRLERLHRLTRFGIGEVETARTKGLYLAHKGELEKGIAELERVKNDPNLPEWMYLSYLAGIYDSARRYETGLELRERAAAVAPENASCWIDAAYSAVRWLNFPERARASLARTEACELNEFGMKYLPFVRGMIHWRERDFETAKKCLEEARENFKSLLGSTPLVEGLILLSKSYLCAVNRELCNSREADRGFKEVESFLVANGEAEAELLAACRPHRRDRVTA